MYWLSVSAIGALFFFYCNGKKKISPALDDESATADAVDSDQGPSNADSDQDILELTDPIEALKQAYSVSDPWQRHMVYTKGIDYAYKKRSSDKTMRSYVVEYGQSYIKRFDSVKEAVFEHFEDSPRLVPIFKQLAIVFEEEKAFDKAIKVCGAAISYGLDDGTNTGYDGRIERLEKKKSAVE